MICRSEDRSPRRGPWFALGMAAFAFSSGALAAPPHQLDVIVDPWAPETSRQKHASKIVRVSSSTDFDSVLDPWSPPPKKRKLRKNSPHKNPPSAAIVKPWKNGEPILKEPKDPAVVDPWSRAPRKGPQARLPTKRTPELVEPWNSNPPHKKPSTGDAAIADPWEKKPSRGRLPDVGTPGNERPKVPTATFPLLYP